MHNELKEVLRDVEMAAVTHRHRLLPNESATRTTLIDPVLRALGWDVANPHKVIVEASARRGRNLVYADYGLFIRDAIEIVVEAKALGEDLRVHRPQVIDYAYAFKVNSIFLTNGLTWEHYDFTSFNPKAFVPSCILNLTSSGLEQTASYMASVLNPRHDNSEEHDIARLCVEADEIINNLSVLVDRICEFSFDQPATSQMPVAALAARFHSLQPKLSLISHPALVNTKIEDFIVDWICKLVKEDGNFFTTQTTEIYELFEKDNKQYKSSFKSEWPKSVGAFGTCLSRITSALGYKGIQVSKKRTALGISRTFHFVKSA